MPAKSVCLDLASCADMRTGFEPMLEVLQDSPVHLSSTGSQEPLCHALRPAYPPDSQPSENLQSLDLAHTNASVRLMTCKACSPWLQRGHHGRASTE